MRRLVLMLAFVALSVLPGLAQSRGTGTLGVVIERADSSILIVDWQARRMLTRVEGLGDLSHASLVFSADQRFAYVFGRDGGLTKVDILDGRIAKRIVQGGNAIGGAISDDGKLIAVSNYDPGGIKVFDAETLDEVASIPAIGANGRPSKTVGLVDIPGRRFVYTLYDAGEIWIADFGQGEAPVLTKFPGIGKLPYDANVTTDGRHYFAGLFGEDGVVHLDLWATPWTPTRILAGYGKGEAPLPVYKMPHFEGWGSAQSRMYLPAIGRHELLVVGLDTLAEQGRIAVHGQPIFAVTRPDGPPVQSGAGRAAHGVHAARARSLALGARRGPHRHPRHPHLRESRRDRGAQAVGHLLHRPRDKDRAMIAADDIALLDRWQRDFPLAARPFARVAREEGTTEVALIACLDRLQQDGVLSRVGAIVRPHSAGWSTLAAMAVPPWRLDEVAATVSAHPLVNHNYARENQFNLWFVVTGRDRAAVAGALADLTAQSGVPVLDLPLEKPYHIDLGFPLGASARVAQVQHAQTRGQADATDRALLEALSEGLAMTPLPFDIIAERTGLAVADILDRLGRMIEEGIVTRFGCVVRHRRLGYDSNAMVVWDVPDDLVDTVAAGMVSNRHVTLCYRRPRRLPLWRYNLFCMVHARSRADALSIVRDLNAISGVGHLDQQVLFSTRCYKQRGAAFGTGAAA
jgi:protein NirF